MKKRALTSIELLLSIAIITLIMAASIPFYFSFYEKSKTESTIKEIEVAIHRAKIKALSSELDDSWGIAVGNDNKITVFKGPSYEERNLNYDESSPIESSIKILNNQEIVFSKALALPNITPTIIINNSNEEVFQIKIDSYGNTQVE